jgi:hypothetical protein
MINKSRNKFLNIISRATQYGPTALEIFLGITAIRWAFFTCLWPSQSFVCIDDTATTMSIILPRILWCLLFFVFGLTQVVLAFSQKTKYRKLIAMQGVFWWSVITGIDAWTGVTSATFVIFLYVFAEALVYLLLSVVFEHRNGENL